MTKKSSISTALKAAFITLGFSFSAMAEVNVASITQYLPEGASASIIAKTSIKIKLLQTTMVQHLCCLLVHKKFSQLLPLN